MGSFLSTLKIEDNLVETIENIIWTAEKKLMIVSFLEGKAKSNLSPENCKDIGIETAKMHELTKNFKIKRHNDLSINSWRNLFDTVKDQDVNLELLLKSNELMSVLETSTLLNFSNDEKSIDVIGLLCT